MLAGIFIGAMAPALVEMVAMGEVASVNFVVAVLIWAMVYPMMVGVALRSLRDVARQPKGLAITLAVNWLIKPFTIAALGVLFFEVPFADLTTPEGIVRGDYSGKVEGRSVGLPLVTPIGFQPRKTDRVCPDECGAGR